MKTELLLPCLVLCSCAIDPRTVVVANACVAPPAGGLLTDFSDARRRECPASIGLCDASTEIVSFGDGAVSGLIAPYQSSDSPTVALTPSSGTPALRALRVALGSSFAPSGAVDAFEGFALRFVDCVDTSNHPKLSFVTTGDLGACPLRFAAEFTDGTRSLDAPCSLDRCFADRSMPVQADSTNILRFDSAGSGQASLAGMEWEFGVDAGDVRDCTADFTIDDLRLTGGP